MVKYCLNCGYDLSKIQMTKLESPSSNFEEEEIIIKKPKIVNKKVIQQELESENEEELNPQEQLLRKVAEKLVIKSKKNGTIDIKKKVSEKQAQALKNNRAIKAQKFEEEKKKTGKPTYTYPKVTERKAEKEAIEIPKEPEPQEPPKNYYNPYSNIF